MSFTSGNHTGSRSEQLVCSIHKMLFVVSNLEKKYLSIVGRGRKECLSVEKVQS